MEGSRPRSVRERGSAARRLLAARVVCASFGAVLTLFRSGVTTASLVELCANRKPTESAASPSTGSSTSFPEISRAIHQPASSIRGLRPAPCPRCNRPTIPVATCRRHLQLWRRLTSQPSHARSPRQSCRASRPPLSPEGSPPVLRRRSSPAAPSTAFTVDRNAGPSQNLRASARPVVWPKRTESGRLVGARVCRPCSALDCRQRGDGSRSGMPRLYRTPGRYARASALPRGASEEGEGGWFELVAPRVDGAPRSHWEITPGDDT